MGGMENFLLLLSVIAAGFVLLSAIGWAVCRYHDRREARLADDFGRELEAELGTGQRALVDRLRSSGF